MVKILNMFINTHGKLVDNGKIPSFLIDNKEKWLLFIGFVILNIVLAWPSRLPFSFPDEYGLLAIGNWLFGGEPWSYAPRLYYGYTFAPFAGLLVRLFGDIRHVYFGALVIKAFMVALVPLFAYKILDEVLNVESKWNKILIAIMVGLYPAFAIFSKRLGNESALFYSLFICFYLIGKCATCNVPKKFMLYSVLLAFFSVWAYASHGMGLAFIVAICLTIAVVHVITKRPLVSYLFFGGSLLVFFFLDRMMKSLVMENVFTTTADGLIRNSFGYAFNRMMQHLTSSEGMFAFVRIFITRLWYVASATYGLFLLLLVVVVVFIVRFIWAKQHEHLQAFFSADENFVHNAQLNIAELSPWPTQWKQPELLALATFSILIIFCGIGLSVLNNIAPVMRTAGTHYFLSRYYGYLVTPLLLVGFHLLLNHPKGHKLFGKKSLLISAGASAAVYLLMSLFVHYAVAENVLGGNVSRRLSVSGILPFVGHTFSDFAYISGNAIRQFSVLSVTLIVLLVFALIVSLLLNKRSKRVTLLVLSAMFLYTAAFGVQVAVHLRNEAQERYFDRGAEIRVALDEVRFVYEQHPYLLIFSRNLGADNTFQPRRSRAQLALLRYDVINVRIIYRRPQTLDNYIAVVDRGGRRPLNFTMGADYTNIHQFEGVYIYIRGDDITQFHAEHYNALQ
ncbi:MAG: hypothetical protein FWD06_09495 [Oscillospiraceae bacterium]|nr:hypothetical protein [Oscillospiraceae bacterium]